MLAFQLPQPVPNTATKGECPIARPPRRSMQMPVKSGPRYDNMINVPKVRVIDHEGENIGVMFTREAVEQANELGLNLVEVSPNADPPVCKFLDVGKHRYEARRYHTGCVKRALRVGGPAYTRRMQTLDRRRAQQT